jgi:hypothetical protein
MLQVLVAVLLNHRCQSHLSVVLKPSGTEPRVVWLTVLAAASMAFMLWLDCNKVMMIMILKHDIDVPAGVEGQTCRVSLVHGLGLTTFMHAEHASRCVGAYATIAWAVTQQ